MSSIMIGSRPVGEGHPPYFIAEVSANHGGDLDRAIRIIRQSAAAGADCVKFQLYTADSLTLDCDRPEYIIGGAGPWAGRRLYDLYDEAKTPAEWFPALFAAAREAGVLPLASVFDADGVAVLEALGAEAYKIASFEAVDLDLIGAVARTGKPLILSTGLCTIDDIGRALEAFRSAGGTDIVLLRCNSAYPADPAEANLAAIPDMRERFGVPVGYSDHTLDAVQAAAAVALGACMVEKHVIDAREPATADSSFSSLPDQFADLVRTCKTVHAARGTASYGAHPREAGSLIFRRSLVVVRPVRKGEVLTRETVRSLRPGHGLPPHHLPKVLGRVATRDIEAGEPLSWDLVS